MFGLESQELYWESYLVFITVFYLPVKLKAWPLVLTWKISASDSQATHPARSANSVLKVRLEILLTRRLFVEGLEVAGFGFRAFWA